MLRNSILLVLLTFTIHGFAGPFYDDCLPSHTKNGEKMYLTALMKKVQRYPSPGVAYKLIPTEKIVSISYYDLDEENIELFYRFGRDNAVEFEKVATQDNPFGTYSKQTGRVGEEILFFSNGNYHYYLSVSTGMGQGVSLYVYKGKKLIAEFFSGTEKTEFELSGRSLPEEVIEIREPYNKDMQ